MPFERTIVGFEVEWRAGAKEVDEAAASRRASWERVEVLMPFARLARTREITLVTMVLRWLCG